MSVDDIVGKTGEQRRLYAMLHWFVAIDPARVNLDDLLGAYEMPGRIVRCDGNPQDCLMVVSPPSGVGESALGCVAGWISESE